MGVMQSICAQEPYAVLSDDNTTQTFYYDNNKTSSGGMSIGPFEYKPGGSTSWSDHCKEIVTVVFDDSFANYTTLSSTAHWLTGCWSLLEVKGINNLKTASVTDMSKMFSLCPALTNLDVRKFNTNKVTDMSGMFSGCKSLTSLDISKFNTNNVTDMSEMIEDLSALTSIDVSNFNTNNVTNMSRMFGSTISGCAALTNLDVRKFNTNKVTDMSGMFSGCESLTSLDVSNFNINKVGEMREMFMDCSNIERIYCNDDWSASEYYGFDMFANCPKLVGNDGKEPSRTNKRAAHPNAGGAFTKKNESLTTVNVETGSQYWQSFYTDTRNVKADETTTVYIATLNESNDGLTLTEIADKIVPCGQAVLMKSTVQNPVLYTSESEGVGDYSTNILKGTQRNLTVSEVSGTVYTLAKESDGFGFYKFAGTTLKAGKAYIAIEGSAAARSLIIVGNTTGINGVEAVDQTDSYYDLQGRRFVSPAKGIYIENGKKVVK